MESREQAILTAVNFLTNPRVTKSSLVQKRNFLAGKGLTDDEIQLAFEKAGIFHKISNLNKADQETRIQITATAEPSSGLQKVSFVVEKFKSLAGTFALVGGFAYGIYLFYKKYIESLLFGGRKKGDKIDELAKTTKAINGEMLKIRDEINKQKAVQESNHKLIQTSLQSFKTEIETIKGILLNKKQFASPPAMSIPSWQLKAQKVQDKINEDAHSANSSENDTEVIHEDSSQKRSPANSDSSLEIM